MDVFIGIDVAKEVHWACAMDRNARVLFSHAVGNDPAAIGALIGSSAIHIGASGLVFGWFGFLVVRGPVGRWLITLGAALVVGVLYGSILWGVLPGQPGVSREAHLFGAIAGAAAAFLVRMHFHAPRLGDVDLD